MIPGILIRFTFPHYTVSCGHAFAVSSAGFVYLPDSR